MQKKKFYILDFPQNGFTNVEIYDEEMKMVGEFEYDPYDPFILEHSSLFKESRSHIEQNGLDNGDYELFYYEEHPKNQDPTI